MPTRHPVAGIGKVVVLCLMIRITTSASICTSRRGDPLAVESAIVEKRVGVCASEIVSLLCRILENVYGAERRIVAIVDG